MSSYRLAALAIAALIATGCGSVTDNLAENLTERALERVVEASDDNLSGVDIDTDGGRIRVETEDGVSEMGFGGDAPEGMSAPLPDGASVLMSSTNPSGYFVQLEVERPLADVVAFYDREYPDAERSEMTSTVDGERFESHTWRVGGDDDGEVTVTASTCETSSGDRGSCVMVIEELADES